MEYGKAAFDSVFGKVIAELRPEKNQFVHIRDIVSNIIKQVNLMDKDELMLEYAKYEEEFKKESEIKTATTSKPRMVLEGAEEGKVILRFPPEPGGYIQLGNIKQAFLSSEFARIYAGKLYLYFDDTNAEKCKQEYVEGIKRDTAWLGLKFDKEYYASDHIEEVYDCARKLIKKGKAYVCRCTSEKIKDERFKGIECLHRSNGMAQNLEEFEQMLAGKKEEGEAVLRYKGDMRSLNTTLRDPTLARVKNITHYRQGNKYHTWPTYDINTPVIDSIMGVTDVIRGKEYELRNELCTKILEDIGMRVPKLHLESMLKIKGTAQHKREIRKLIAEGMVTGWDDPRLVTAMAFRRRGVQPLAIKNFVLRFGMSLVDSVMEMSALMAENRKVIDSLAKHLYFVADPKELSVANAKKTQVKLRLHPSNDIGYRQYEVGSDFYIAGDDFKGLKEGSVIRLKDFIQISIESKSAPAKARLERGNEGAVIQWVSKEHAVKCTVMVPGEIIDDDGHYNKDSLTVLEGYAESYVSELKEHDIVQFERFGYCILDSKKEMRFIFISK